VDILQNQVTRDTRSPLPTRNGSWDSRAASHLAASTLKIYEYAYYAKTQRDNQRTINRSVAKHRVPTRKRGREWTREDQSGREKKIRQFTSKWLRSDPSRCGDRLHSICIRVAHSGLKLLLRLFSFSSVCAALGCVLCIAERLSSRQSCWER
jgi:hypothetical protein